MVTARDPVASFLAHDDLVAAAARAATTVRARNAWFRIAVVESCISRSRTTAELMERLEIQRTETTRRIALRNLASMVRNEFLVRSDDGYRTTGRGKRVLADLSALGLDDAERAA